MANRRMFSLDVVDTDKFLDMPATSQNLYFHLGMRADDDGFVSSPKKITKLVNCGKDDLNVLISRGYVFPVGDGLIVISHWKQNNYIQKDRYKRTIYTKELENLVIDNGVYNLDTACIQNVSKLETQDSIGKSNNIYSAPEDAQESENEEKQQVNDEKKALEQAREDFEIIYKLYPKKKGKTKAFEYYRGFIGRGRVISSQRYRLTNEQIWSAVNAYVAERRQQGTELEFYQDFSRFMNKTILDYLPEERTE